MKNITDFIKLEENEHVFEYTLTGDYSGRYCIAESDADISKALEDTLHRLIDAGASDTTIFEIMGAYDTTIFRAMWADTEELAELEELDEYIPIDLGYIIDGMMLSFQQI